MSGDSSLTIPKACRKVHRRLVHARTEASRAEKTQAHAKALAFLTNQEEETGLASTKKRKHERIATYDATCMLDWELQCSTGEGLASFNPYADSGKPLHKRRRLTLCIDTVNKNMCMGSACLNLLKKRMMLVPDPIHRAIRSMWSGCQDSCKMKVVLMISLLASTDLGPFGSKGNLATFRLVCEDFLANLSNED